MLSDLTSPWPDRLVYCGTPPRCRDGLYNWVEANYSAFWRWTLEEGIKECWMFSDLTSPWLQASRLV